MFSPLGSNPGFSGGPHGIESIITLYVATIEFPMYTHYGLVAVSLSIASAIIEMVVISLKKCVAIVVCQERIKKRLPLCNLPFHVS